MTWHDTAARQERPTVSATSRTLFSEVPVSYVACIRRWVWLLHLVVVTAVPVRGS
jgi:1-acyl-sn-glycerol-3-phosphate acyltransferase